MQKNKKEKKILKKDIPQTQRGSFIVDKAISNEPLKKVGATAVISDQITLFDEPVVEQIEVKSTKTNNEVIKENDKNLKPSKNKVIVTGINMISKHTSKVG